MDFNILEFNEFEDKELDKLLSCGVLSDIPTIANAEITATQVLGLSTQDLIPEGSNPEPHNGK